MNLEWIRHQLFGGTRYRELRIYVGPLLLESVASEFRKAPGIHEVSVSPDGFIDIRVGYDRTSTESFTWWMERFGSELVGMRKAQTQVTANE